MFQIILREVPNHSTTSLDETLDIGEDTGMPVSEDYKVPFKFTSNIEKVVSELENSPNEEASRFYVPANNRFSMHVVAKSER